MLFEKIKSKFTFVSKIVLSLLFIVSVSNLALGETMNSDSYKIQSDSMNFGGARSSSDSYSIEDTLGEVATGESESDSFKVKAGYQQMQESILSMTSASDVVMSPNIGGVSGGTSNGSTNFTVTTDNSAGYTVTIKASSTPAMQSIDDSIDDYTPVTSDPDYDFSVPSSSSEFAFSPEGDDVDQKFKDDGGDCNTGSLDTVDKCWAGLSTVAQTIVTRTSANHTSGTETTLKFRVESGSSHVQTNGTYTATTTITALPL